MISIHNIRDLERFGFYRLTGEACRVGYRSLYDITGNGRKVIADLLGIIDCPHDIGYPTFARAWNGQNKCTASVMLPFSMLGPLSVWCLIHHGCPEIIESDDGVHGLEVGESNADDSEWQQMYDHLEHFKNRPRKYKNHINLPGQGTRATHAMSGRTE